METNWIRFDPDDELTWPEFETDHFGKAVLVCDTDCHIYIGFLWFYDDEKDNIAWSLTNEAEDVTVPIYCVTAWMPLPEPYKAQEALPADDQGEWLIDDTGCTYTCNVCGAKYVMPIMQELPEQCPKCKSRMERLGTWLFNAGDYTCSECGETFSDELFYISRSREPGLPGHCPGCGFPMKTKEAKQ